MIYLSLNSKVEVKIHVNVISMSCATIMIYLSLNSKVEVKIHVNVISMCCAKLMKTLFPKSCI